MQRVMGTWSSNEMALSIVLNVHSFPKLREEQAQGQMLQAIPACWILVHQEHFWKAIPD